MGINQCCKRKELPAEEPTSSSTKVNGTLKGESYPSSTIVFQPLPSKDINEYFIGIEKAIIIGKGSGNPKDKYKFGKKLGEGAFGVVYMAQNIQTDALCAIKVLKRTKANKSIDDETIKEIELLKELDHPNIIKIFEFYESPTHFYIVTEFCRGGDLFSKLMEEGGQSEITSALVMFQLLGAINYCHNLRIMHRDLKPENIMLEDRTRSGNPHIKVIDFGTARFFSKNLEQLIGTCYYIAPEVLKLNYNEKCDLWSCGVILYILLKGKFPFGGGSQDQVFANIKKGVYNLTNPPFDKLSNEVKDLIQKLLEKDTTKRISAAEAMEHPWFAMLKIKQKLTELSLEKINNALNNICKYNPQKKLQQAAIAYLVHNNPQLEEINDARCLFLKIDKNNDGLIPISEFREGLELLFKEQNKHVERGYLDELFKRIDADNSNNIEYEEFVRAGINKTKLLEEKLLVSAFDFFATPESKGKITLEQIKTRFKQNKDYPDEEFKKIITEFDINLDGMIDINEFKQVMAKILD